MSWDVVRFVIDLVVGYFGNVWWFRWLVILGIYLLDKNLY